MFPLVALAISLVPELIRLIAGDKAGKVADLAATAVRDVAGDDPVAAQAKINVDPQAAAQLRTRLAEIALDAQKEQDAAGAAERQAELEQTRQILADRTAARTSLNGLVALGSPIAWGAPVVSVVVAVGFFVILGVLATNKMEIGKDPNAQVVLTLVGTMATAFATMVAFWLGSSQGSRNKDDTLRQISLSQQQQTPAISVNAPDLPPGSKLDESLQSGDTKASNSLTMGGGNTAPADPGTSSTSGASTLQFGSLVSGGFFSSKPFDLSVPRSIRTNNAGALNISEWQRTRPGFAGVTDPDASASHNVTTIYRTPEHGIAAWYHLITKRYGFEVHGQFTVGDLAIRYFGRPSGPAVDGYVAGWSNFSAAGPFDASTVIRLDDEKAILNFARAMFGHEAGRQTPVHDDQILLGLSLEGSEGMPLA